MCITHIKLLEYSALDSFFQLVKKPAIVNLISAIKNCGFGYKCDTGFKDKACRLLLPNRFDDYSLNFGDNDFFISFDDHDNKTGNCIVLYYDLQKDDQHFFSKRLLKFGQAYDSLKAIGKTMYQFKTSHGLYAGEILLDDYMSVGYYASDLEMEKRLQTCILSCRIE